MTGHLLVKSDVYSYGVVLLELLSGRKPVHVSDLQDPENLVVWARPLLGTREGLEQLLDPYLRGNCDFDNVAKVAAVASTCVHGEQSQRPFMGEVVQALKLACSNKEEACCEDSYSQKEPSFFSPDCEFKGDFGPESSWWSGASPPLSYGPYGHASSFLNMEYGSDSWEEMQRPHSVSGLVGRGESLAGYSHSGPLRAKRKKQKTFYRSKGSVSEHGHPWQRSHIDMDN